MCLQDSEANYVRKIQQLEAEIISLKEKLAEYSFRLMDDGK